MAASVASLIGVDMMKMIESKIFRPNRPHSLTGVEGVHFAGNDTYWMSPPLQPVNSAITVIYFHSNAVTLLNGRDFLLQLRSLLPWTTLLAPEYPGYSKYDWDRDHRASIEGSKRAILNIVDSALPPPESRRSFIVIGHTIGAVFASWFAHRPDVDCKGLILLSPFVSVKKMAIETHGRSAATVVSKHILNNKKELYKVDTKVPVLIVHGLKDEIIPNHHARILQKVCLSRGLTVHLSEMQETLERDRSAWIAEVQNWIYQIMTTN